MNGCVHHSCVRMRACHGWSITDYYMSNVVENLKVNFNIGVCRNWWFHTAVALVVWRSVLHDERKILNTWIAVVFLFSGWRAKLCGKVWDIYITIDLLVSLTYTWQMHKSLNSSLTTFKRQLNLKVNSNITW